MAETVVDVGPRQQERTVPEKNTIADFQNFFYCLGAVTRESTIKRSDFHVERPMAERAARAQLYRLTRRATREQQKVIVQEAQARDEIARQYLNQGEVKVHLSGLGEQVARYTIINPPEFFQKEGQETLPPIVLIPGISNDIEGVGALTQELATFGRKTITIGYPESSLGRITEEFAEKVETSTPYELHAEFFRHAIDAILPETAVDVNSPFELWGFSAGGAIVPVMLQDETYRQRVAEAVLICPASNVNMTWRQLERGILNDLAMLATRVRDTARYAIDIPSIAKKPTTSQEKLKKMVFDRLTTNVLTQSDAWKTARVRNGGHITVVSGDRDFMTRSAEVFANKEETREQLHKANPQLSVVNLSKGTHGTPLIEPNKVLSLLFGHRQRVQTTQ